MTPSNTEQPRLSAGSLVSSSVDFSQPVCHFENATTEHYSAKNMDFLKTPEMRLHADAKVQDILDEISSGERDEVAWVKALKAAKGDTSYAQALYIEERMKRLADFEHVIAVDRREKRLNYLQEELKDIKKTGGNRSKIFLLITALFLPFSAVLFWEGDVELGAAVLIVFLLGGIITEFKLSRLDKRRKEITSELDKLSPQPDSAWLSSMILLALVIAAVGYFLASL